MAYPKVNGVPLDLIFDPYISGTKAPITGYTVKIDGVTTDLKDLFAPLYLGATAAITNYKVNNVDLNQIFAKKGTAQYALPINGATYSSNAQSRGTAQLDFNLKSDGTYSVVRSGTAISTTTLASGTWLPAGDSVSDYSTLFSATQSGSTQGSGSNTVTNGASTQSSLTTTRTLTAKSVAALTGDQASANATVVVKIYKSATLISTTTFSLATNANGN